MSEPFVGEIRLVGFNFAPAGWNFCDGSLLSISEFETLFVLIGTTYGGDGQTTFQLPDLRGRLPLHQGRGVSSYVMGQTGGQESVTLMTPQLPVHSHQLTASGAVGDSASPIGNYFAGSTAEMYSTTTPNAGNVTASTSGAGGSQSHSNVMPYLCVNYIISLFGIFPSQN